MSQTNLNNAKAPIGYGKDYNFYKSITLSGAAYDENDGYACHVLSKVVGNIVQIKFTVTDGSDLHVSFNGTTDHLHLVGDIGTRKEFTYPNLQKTKFWFRGSGTVEIEYYVS